MAHKKYSPSGSKGWLNCLGRLEREERLREEFNIIDTSNAAAELGTGVHEVGEYCLLDEEINPSGFLGEKMNGHVMTQDCIDAVQIYVDFCRNLMKNYEFCGVESGFTHPHNKNLGGTIDFWSYDPSTAVLHVVDYKNGEGDAVFAYKNTQGMIYALLVLLELNRKKHNPRTLFITIVQPRHYKHESNGGISEWCISAEYLLAWADWVLYPAIEKIETQKDLPLTTGDHCKWCPVDKLNRCEARLKELAFVDEEANNDLSDEEKVSYILTVADRVKEKIKSAHKQQLEWCLKKGIHNHRKAIQGYGNRQLIETNASKLAKATGLVNAALYKEQTPTLKSPAQIEQAMKDKGLEPKEIKAIMTPLTIKPKGSIQLVSADHKAPHILSHSEMDEFDAEDVENP